MEGDKLENLAQSAIAEDECSSDSQTAIPTFLIVASVLLTITCAVIGKQLLDTRESMKIRQARLENLQALLEKKQASKSVLEEDVSNDQLLNRQTSSITPKPVDDGVFP